MIETEFAGFALSLPALVLMQLHGPLPLDYPEVATLRQRTLEQSPLAATAALLLASDGTVFVKASERDDTGPALFSLACDALDVPGMVVLLLGATDWQPALRDMIETEATATVH